MPTPVDKLEKGSSDAQIKAAISDCIQMEMNNGKAQDQATAMCYQMMRDKTGNQNMMPPKGGE